MASEQILAGVWEDVVADNAPQLAGRRVRIYVEAEEKADQDGNSLEAAIARLNRRKPEEVSAARCRILAATAEPQPVPAGKTLTDVVMGQWPGEESDAQITEALRKLS